MIHSKIRASGMKFWCRKSRIVESFPDINPFGNNRYKDVFGRLNRDILEKWAAKWALQYPNVSKIVLYGLPLKYCAESNFIIYFKFKSKEDAAKFEQDYAMRPANFIGPEFAEVYQEFPTYRFEYEWYFTTSKEPWMNDRFSLIIFKKSNG